MGLPFVIESDTGNKLIVREQYIGDRMNSMVKNRQMTGKIYLSNAEEGIGKVIFTDGTETKSLKFPSTIQSGDIADVTLSNLGNKQTVVFNDITSPDTYYGSLMKSNALNSSSRAILVSFPHPLGLIYCNHSDLHADARNLKFTISKDMNGNLTPINIRLVAKNEVFMCRAPKYGKLTIHPKEFTEGYISNMETSLPANVNIGVVSYINQKNGSYGFIHKAGTYILKRDKAEVTNYAKKMNSQKEGGIFFNMIGYRNRYNKAALVGDIVYYCSMDTAKGTQVSEFLSPIAKQEILTIQCAKKSYQITKAEYENTLKKAPEIGSIVTGIIKNERFTLLPEKTKNSSEFHLIPDRKSQGVIESGKIISFNAEIREGMVFSYGKRIKFNGECFQQAFAKPIPYDDQRVEFEIMPGRSEVLRFYSYSRLVLDSAKLNNFVEINTQDIYKVFHDISNASGIVFKIDFSNINDALGVYKSPDVDIEHKLAAIETLIKYKFRDTNIKPAALKQERLKLLSELISAYISMQDFQTAFKYEMRMQELQYDPKRLTKYHGMPKLIELMDAILEVSELIYTYQKWDLMDGEIRMDETEIPAFRWLVDEQELKHDIDPDYPSKAWKIDLNSDQYSSI